MFYWRKNQDEEPDHRCYFVTTTCHKHKHLLSDAISKQILIASLCRHSEKYNADIIGYVIMPNHLHFIVFFKDIVRLSDFMRDIKKDSSYHIRNHLKDFDTQKYIGLKYIKRAQLRKVWDDGYHWRTLYTTNYLVQKLQYIHNNPLQDHWKLAELAEDYPYSSAGFYRAGRKGPIKITHFTTYFEIPLGSP